jgi:hypothetical protein
VNTGFLPSKHGFPFPNWFAPGRRVLGPVRYPGGGVCGGMVFTALDHFLAGAPLPAGDPDDLLPHLWRRLLASWNLPFGVLRYYDWQRRPQQRVNELTAAEWPRIKACLDAGLPAPLGLVQADGWHPRRLPLHHQALAVGYELDGDAVTLGCYDPNWPGDDTLTLAVDLTAARPPAGGHAGPDLRGLFLTEYRRAEPVHGS